MFLPLYALKVIEVQGLTESTLGDQVTAAAKELGVEVQTDREPEQKPLHPAAISIVSFAVASPRWHSSSATKPGRSDEKTRRAWVRERYHKPSDDLTQPVRSRRCSQIQTASSWVLLQRVADDPARPKWKDDSFFKRFAK
jgi:hypothetical protein